MSIEGHGMSAIKTVTDRNGVRYELAEMLGRGGQGAVYAVKGGRLAAKIMAGGNQTDRDQLRNQLMHVRRLPLNDLALAKPLEVLRPPQTGYIMELLTGMVPIKSLLSPQKGQPSSVEWYVSGGGLRRRLLLLGRAGQVMAQLHGRGLVYSDPSPTNIFISKSLDAYEIRFIDTDNLRYESTPLRRSRDVFTPGFGAAELVTGKSGVTTLTDVYAFAILAFQTLALVHPFIGDLVDNGEPELEELAFTGKLTWIEDPEDDRNSTTFGIPRQWVLSPRLLETFRQTFGPGRTKPILRPGAEEWAERLFAAADASIRCTECSSTYFFTQPSCPWCDNPRPNFVITHFYLWAPDCGPQGGIVTKPKEDKNHPVRMGHGVVSDGETFLVCRRHAFGNSKGPVTEPVLSVTLAGAHIKLRSLDGGTYQLFSPSGSKKTEIDNLERSLKIEEGRVSWRLHFGGSDTIHRVLEFELRRGGRS